MVMEQIANLSARMCCQGSNPCLSATGCSVARLSRLLWEQEVAGSNPATPTTKSQTKLSGFFILKGFEPGKVGAESIKYFCRFMKKPLQLKTMSDDKKRFNQNIQTLKSLDSRFAFISCTRIFINFLCTQLINTFLYYSFFSCFWGI